MYHPASSPFSSPVRKRQRLSSPTYDEQLGDFSQADIDAFDQLEAHLSQPSQKYSSQNDPRASPQPHAGALPDVRTTNNIELSDDPDNPFSNAFDTAPSFTTASSLASLPTFTTASTFATLPSVTFAKASALDLDRDRDDFSRSFSRSPSPEEPPNQDFDAWFQPAGTIPPIAFQSATTILETPALSGFTKASNKGILAPSSAALAKAKERMKEIWHETDSPTTNSISSASCGENLENGFKPASSLSSRTSPRRPALQPVANSNQFASPGFGSPCTPSPAGLAQQLDKDLPMSPIALFISKNSKPFKSPLLSKNPSSPKGLNVSVPTSTLDSRSGFSSARSQHPLASAPINASNFSSLTTPARHPKVITVGSSTKKTVTTPFVTPFKPGMKPGEPGRLKLEEAMKATPSKQPMTSLKRKSDRLTTDKPGDMARHNAFSSVFNLDLPPNRQTLRASGLIPQQYTHSELEAMGINSAELSQMTPALAKYYAFHTASSNPSLPLTSTPAMLGPVQAFNTLLENGCSLATQDWVDNHWGLILWKLAGMVRNLTGERVSAAKQSFRYERELNQGKRPPLRLVTTRDVPAAYPMVLCVSDLIWTNPSNSEEGDRRSESHAELELTDGWYRLRARIDAPMARAVRRGHIRVGRKIAVAGAYLLSDKKDGSEVLDSYSSVKLVLSGNSSHMAPWHAKLGFNPGPCISSLRSLTPDGGTVAAVDIVVVKTHPIAYIEFAASEDAGLQPIDGPMNATDEAAAQEKWKKKWENEMTKLRTEYEKRWNRYEGYLDRLERYAGAEELPSSQDFFPLDVLEGIYDELEDPANATSVLAGLGKKDCSALGRFIRDRLQKEKAHAREDMDNELQHICPPRVVKNFRIIVVQDARTRKYPGNRKALLNVWDVLNLSFSEGGSPGHFEIGQRFMTGLIGNKSKAYPSKLMDGA
ncbi:hypothetical protein H0H92_002150 [Tricholoma furcatifolium]|nr:hypothetical protein H0H92_002150 [Tricholoma furcatifolium]